MTTPTITPYPGSLPAKEQSNPVLDTNVDDFLTWLTDTNGPELAIFVTYAQDVANNVLATALAGDLPPLTGKAGDYIRANAAEDGGEFRTPAQVLADIGGLAPDGDGSGLSGIVTTLAGAISAFAFTSVPTGWLECDGSTVSRTTYSALFTAIGDTFGAGDGSTTFVIPDLRGEFVRGWDNGRGVDASRAFSSAQDEAFKLHGHPSRRLVTQGGGADSDGGGLLIDSTASQVNMSAYTGTPSNVYGRHIGGEGGDETRPRNIAMMYCIKF
jgi:microcystin-dependent protein